jgi:serine/threonine protein kinase
MSSRTITSVVTADTMALNAAVFGYAGHSLVTPHAAIQQIWWTEERIDAKVTREFIISKLRPDERERLHRPVGFGDGLTDDTYLDWILAKARRFYLILVECGTPDQIFGVIDDSWDDDDLPVPLADVDRLALSYRTDERLNIKFHSTQFQYLLRIPIEASHIDYASNEVVPVEYVHRLPPAAALQNWLRIHMPKKPEKIYTRRKMSFGKDEKDPALEAQFRADVETMRSVPHPHIASIWFSYTAKNAGFFVTDFVSEHTLKSFIEFRSPASFQKMEKAERHGIMLGWMHCLADAIAHLHENGICHSAITPTNVVIDAENNVAFADIGSLKSFQTDKKRDQTEAYNYGAPENHPPMSPEESPRPATSRGFHRRRKRSMDSKTSSEDGSQRSHNSQMFDGSSVSSPPRSSMDSQATFMPLSPLSAPESLLRYPNPKTLSIDSSPTSPSSDLPPSILTPSIALTLTSTTSSSATSNPDCLSPTTSHPIATPHPVDEKSDIFSLGCIFLDIATFLFKKKPYSEFLKHRSTKYKQSRGSRLDSSFHANPERVSSWMEILEHEAFDIDETVFRAIPPLFAVIRLMLNPSPPLRPTAATVRDRLFDVLISYAKLPTVHCGGRMQNVDFATPLQPVMSVSTTFSAESGKSGKEDARLGTSKDSTTPMATGSSRPKSRPAWRRRLVGVR